MELDYYLLDPTGNMTILVRTAVPEAEQPRAAARLMAAEPSAEQVGFLTEGADGCDAVLRMAGGEFCGNAAMSAGALWAFERGLERARVCLRVSGAADNVEAVTERVEAGVFTGTVEMPRPERIRLCSLPLDGAQTTLPVVEFAGISHVIAEHPIGSAAAEHAVKAWCGLLGAAGLGLMLLDRAAMRLTPLVYVPAADTLFWESSCASGTAAVGAYLAAECGGSVELSVSEPGGSLLVTAEPDGGVQISGKVKIVKKGRIFVPEN